MRRLAISLLAAVAIVLILTPPTATPAEPPCQYTEDGRCIPAPVPLPPEQAASAPKEQQQGPPKGPGVLVKRKPDVTPAAFKAKLQAHGFAESEGLTVEGWWRVPVPAGEAAEHVIDRLRALPDVEAVEEDKLKQMAATPNDQYFTYQWNMPKVQAPEAWDITMGSRSVWIAVVDSGLDYNHPDRPAYFWLGYDYVNGDAYPYDDNGHGTHVAGIAGAATNNAIGTAGVCPSCEILAVKVLNASGYGYPSNTAQGIQYAAYWGSYYGKRTIINLSVGGSYSQVEADAVSYAQGLGALVVAAAGNGGPGGPSFPAALSGVIAVSATDINDAPAPYSQYGILGAPGGDGSGPGPEILSTVPTWYANPPYYYMTGTSMASPHVAGAAGLVWSQSPGCSGQNVRSELALTPDVPAGWNASYGAGRLNVNRAILRFTTSTLPIYGIGKSYSTTLGVFGGAGSKTFAVVSGTLPPGFSLDPSTGTISGTSTQVGTYSFTVRTSDGVCESAERVFVLSGVELKYSVVLPEVRRN